MGSVRKLLAVDDEPDFAEYVRRVGEAVGYEARALTDPTMFHDVYDAFRPDVVFVDMVMPDVEGIELVQWLAQQGSSARVYILSGYNPHYAQMAHVLGQSGGLQVEAHTKPISLSKLRALLA